MPNIEVIGEAENGRQAVKFVKRTATDVVVMDVAMPVLDGLAATRQIRKCAPRAKVLVLTSYGEETYVDKLMEAGAAGFLIKQTAVNDLVRAIREVQRGRTFLSPLIAQRLRNQRQALVEIRDAPQPSPHWLFPQFELFKGGLAELSPSVAPANVG